MLNKVKKETVAKKTFSYSKGKVSLTFTLRNDTVTELKDFLGILKVAQEDVVNELK